MDKRITRGDAAMETGRGELRRQSSEHSATVADRALVAWLAERRVKRGGDFACFDSQIREGDEDGMDRAELELLELGERVRV